MTKWIITTVVLLAILAALFFWLSRDNGYSSDRDVAEAQQLFEKEIDGQLSELEEPASDNMIRIEGGEFSEKMGELNEQQQTEMANAMIPRVMEMMTNRFRRVLDLPPDEQLEALDQIIDQQQQQSAAMEKMRARAEQPGASSQRVAVDGDSDDGERWLMDNMSAEQRATMEAYVDLIKARMKERGMKEQEVPISIGITVGGPGP